MERHSYEEIMGMERQRKTLIEKLNHIRKEQAIETDPSLKFKYEKQIAGIEAETREIEKKIESAYNIFLPEKATILRKLIESLNIDEKMGLIHLVNCGREDMKDIFWATFDGHEEEDFQFYFIGACPTQMPPHFAERLIYELIIEELEDKLDAIYCKRKSNGRLQILGFPSNSRGLKKSQTECYILFSKIFEFSPSLTFDDFLNLEISKLKYQYVTLVFEIYESEWRPFFGEYLEWFIGKFSSIKGDTPKFLFFFVVYVEDMHREDRQSEKRTEITAIINELQSQFPGVVGLLPLDPIPVKDLRTWLMKLGEKNPNKFEDIIKILQQNLSNNFAKKNFEEKKLLNMDIVSRLQELVYTIFQKK